MHNKLKGGLLSKCPKVTQQMSLSAQCRTIQSWNDSYRSGCYGLRRGALSHSAYAPYEALLNYPLAVISLSVDVKAKGHGLDSPIVAGATQTPSSRICRGESRYATKGAT